MNGLLKQLPNNRRDAREVASLHYYTGKPCKRGHIDKRLSSSADCMACALTNSATWKKFNMSTHLLHCQQWKALHKEQEQKTRQLYYVSNKQRICDQSAEWRQRYPDRVCASANHRRATQLKATPSWSDAEQIQQFYTEAAHLTQLTGVEYQVDHIIPLRGKQVCGLHVHTNLQVLTATDNRRKGNKHD